MIEVAGMRKLLAVPCDRTELNFLAHIRLRHRATHLRESINDFA
jgi:hypothetical protein